MKSKLLLILAVSLGFSMSHANAQVKKREVRQHARIHQGVKSGELTRAEAKNLREDQKDVRQDVRMAKSDGKVTAGEKKMIMKEENQNSREIYRKKHNDRERK